MLKPSDKLNIKNPCCLMSLGLGTGAGALEIVKQSSDFPVLTKKIVLYIYLCWQII